MKRARPEPSAEETDKEKEATYKKGAILRIKLENFVTYGNVEFRPGPRLNVVIGPNGTGKSTVVCAIALGLGGKPAVLGRAKNEFEFIKAGSGDWATIEIELKGDVKNYIIKRKIIKKGENSDASEWWLDGKRTTEKEVHQVVNSLDIQIDNLCQFLPQDKVASFAKLNEVELLRETEKAIGEKENFFETHEELIKRQKGEKDTQIELEALKQKQKEEKAKQDILERDVLRYRESEKYKARKKDLEAKRPWLIFERHRSQSKELKDTTEKLKAEVEGLKERTAPLRERVNALKTDLAKADREKAGVSASLKQHDADRKSVGRQIEELEAKFETAYADLERAKENAAERKKRIESIKNEIAKQNEELATLRPTADINAELEAKNDQVRKLDEQKSKLAAEHNPLMVQLNAQRRHQNDAERALKDIQDQRNQRLDEVKRTNYESFQFNRWANSPETTGKLTGRAWGPLLLEINVSPEFAPYLEHAVRSSFFKFVAENVDDRNVLLDYADRANAKVTIAVMANRDNLAHPVPDEALRKYGKFKWLNEAFDAPEAVKLYLSQVHRLHEIPVFYEREEDGFIILRENPKLKIVLTRRDSLSRKNSQYTKEASFSRDSIEPPKKLAGVDPNRKHKLEQDIIAAKAKVAELLGKQDEFSDKIKAIDQKIDELRNEVRALRAMAPKRNTIMKRLETLKSDLRDAEKTENLVELEKRVETKLRGYNMERLLHSVKLAEIHASMSDATVKHDLAILRRIKLQAQADRANQALYAAEGELRAREAELERAAEELRKSMDQLKRLKEAAVSEAPLTEELKKKFEELPNTVEALDEEITSTIGKLQALRGHMRDDAVQEYEMKQRELEDMEARIKELMENRERSARTLVSDTLEFKKQLQEKISKIDAACSELFKHLDCPANVTLDSSSEDLSRWSLAIAVSFRKNMKQKALGNTQSGGERAVTTMLFLISLQDYTSCGFRLVDEINQGMDPKNERQVFELIAKSASKPGLPQYFLITPKLLPDLSFDNDTSVLCVFNGPSAPKQRQWNTSVSKLVRGGGAAQ